MIMKEDKHLCLHSSERNLYNSASAGGHPTSSSYDSVWMRHLKLQAYQMSNIYLASADCRTVGILPLTTDVMAVITQKETEGRA